MSAVFSQYLASVRSWQGVSAINWRPQQLAANGTRLYWLEGSPLTLFSADLSEQPRPVSCQVFSSGMSIDPNKSIMTKEEELLRERQRNMLKGVSSFRVVNERTFFFQASGKVFLAINGAVHDVFELAGAAMPSGVPTAIAHSPGNPYFLTFVVKSNIYAITVAVGDENQVAPLSVKVEQLTTIGTPSNECGSADYIMQEEFSRYEGHWVSPAVPGTAGRKIAFTITDTSALPSISLVDDKNNVETMPFPKVGDCNATSIVAVRCLDTGEFRVLPTAALLKVFPAMEYIARVNWSTPESLYLVVLDRRQEELRILEVDVVDLFSVGAAENRLVDKALHSEDANGLGSHVRTLFSQSIPWAWCEVHDSVLPLASISGNPMVVAARVVAPGQPDDGYMHLWRVSRVPGVPPHQLTSGPWNVRVDTVKVCGRQVFFKATVDPLLFQLFVTDALHDGAPRKPEEMLVSEPGWHIEAYCPIATAPGTEVEAASRVAVVAMTMTMLPTLKIIGVRRQEEEPNSQKTQVIASIFDREAPAPVLLDSVAPLVHSFANRRGVLLHSLVFLPAVPPAGGQQGASCWPWMMYVYGGPGPQLVKSQCFDVRCNPVFQALLKNGVAVVVVDNQMSACNGLRALSIVKKAMGTFETQDFVDAVAALTSPGSAAATLFRLDPVRVGIFGFSYGGYAALLAMCQAKETFRLCFAGAPVGDFRLYDTAYTERYMGLLPADNDAYVAASIPTYASGFPDEMNRVFIAHGLSDENVHFAHSSAVLTAMVDEGKPYQLLGYPGERHSLRKKDASRQHFNAMTLYIASLL